MPSTFETKWKRLEGMRNSSNARTAMWGPRSDPPIPMFTTSVMAVSLRTFSKGQHRVQRAVYIGQALSCFGHIAGQSHIRRPAQQVQHGTVLCGVDGLARKHGVAVRFQANGAARSSSSASESRSHRFLDRSANTGADWLKCAKRSASCSNAAACPGDGPGLHSAPAARARGSLVATEGINIWMDRVLNRLKS